MRWNRCFAMRTTWFRLALCACMPVMTLALPAARGKRVSFAPRLVKGETLRYRIESRTTTTGKTTTPIANPEGGSQSSLLIHLLVRLDVLDVPPAGGSGGVRLRATYEKSSAESDSDAFDPAQSSPGDQYARLEGRSIEFTIAPGGQVADIKGLEDIFPDRTAAQSALSWMGEFSSGSGFPANGVEIGQKWKSERPVPGAPLLGLAWRVESTYLRDEPCRSYRDTSGSPLRPSTPESCAVILSRLEIWRPGSSHSDATPEDYRRNGLRVSGSWTGSGEGLDSVSLSTGLLVRSTQTSEQQMDYRITSAATGSSIRNQGRVQTQSEITLVSTSQSSTGP
jgi:hypothetical protein